MAKTRFRILGFRFLNVENRNFGGTEYHVRAMQKAHYGHNDWIMFYQHVRTGSDNLSFTIDNALYDDEHIYGTADLAVGVCAIVGQNGSGKSTILDMIIRVLNNVAASLAGEDVLYSAAEHLHYIENVYGAILFLQEDNLFQLSVEGHNIAMVKYCKTEINGGVTYKEKEEHIPLLIEDKYKPGTLLPLRAKELKRLSSLFYTVIINYSLYAYYYNDYYQEATEEGKLNKLKRKPKLKEFPFEQFWMTGLFHKNDGYQTPVVINPMRVGGRIDAPKENKLAKERIMSLLFVEAKDGADKDYNERYPFRVINGNLHIMALALPERQDIHLRWTKDWMRERGYFGNRSRLYQKYDEYSEYIIDYFKQFYGIDTTVKHYLYATRYLVYKIFKIGLTYMNYNCIISNLRHADFSFELLNSHLKRLMEDDAHITVKLRRVVMYLTYGKDVYGQPQDKSHPFVYELKDIEPKIEKAMEEFNEANISVDLTKRAKRLFSYDAYEYQGVKGPKQSSRIARFFMKHANDMQLYTCHYCDMAYINTYPTGPRKKNNHFDLDHVLDKGKCPILALSFFNFVPVCPVCNGRIKSTKQVATTTLERKKLSPTNPNYDFEGKVTIWIDHPAGKCSTFGFEKRMNEYELKFDCHKDLDYQKEIDFFRLVPRYNFHKCEALRLMDLKERYTEARIVEMARLIMGDDATKAKDLGADSIIDQIKKDIFADDFMNDHHRVFGKLHKDILS